MSVDRTNNGFQITVRNLSKAPVRFTAFGTEPVYSAEVFKEGKWTPTFFRCGMGMVERELPPAKSIVGVMPYDLISAAKPGDRVRISVHMASPWARSVFSNEIVIGNEDIGSVSWPVRFAIPPVKG